MKKFFIFLILFFMAIGIVFLGASFLKKEENIPNNTMLTVQPEFIIDKVIYYSSANAISNTTNYQNPEWNLNVYQYTDIAIYIHRLDNSKDLQAQNYITQINLENFTTGLENVKVYYLNPNDFGNRYLKSDNLVEDQLKYTIINSENEENTQSYNIPVFFQDCSNPITLRIVTELSKQYQVPKENTLVYNGTLIKELGLDISNLNQEIGFDITLVTKNAVHTKNICLTVPYVENEKNILEGDIQVERNENISF